MNSPVLKAFIPVFGFRSTPLGGQTERSPEHCLPGGAPSWVGCVLWGPPGSGKGRKPSGEGGFGRRALRPPRRLGPGSLEANIASVRVVEWGRRERAGRPKNEGGKRRGEEGENKRICASTLPSSLSCLLSSSWSSYHLCSREILTHSLLRRKTQLSCARVHKFWVVKIVLSLCALRGFPAGSDGRASVCNGGDPGLIPRSGRSPGEGNGNPLQYSCLENSMDGGAWWATGPWGPRESGLSDFTLRGLRQIKENFLCFPSCCCKMGAMRAFYFILLLSGVPAFGNYWI